MSGQIARIWRSQPVFQRRKFFKGRPIRGADIKDLSWLDPTGGEMTDEAWNAGYVKCLGMQLAGDLIGDVDERGQPIVGETVLILMNAHWEPLPFALPAPAAGHHWEHLVDTSDPTATATFLGESASYPLKDRSVVVLRQRRKDEPAGLVLSGQQTEQILEGRLQPAGPSGGVPATSTLANTRGT